MRDHNKPRIRELAQRCDYQTFLIDNKYKARFKRVSRNKDKFYQSVYIDILINREKAGGWI